jgi:uncharacterized membrane protein
MIWGVTAIDLIALVCFATAWIGFAPILRWIGKNHKLVAMAMIEHRRAWMHSLLGREMKVHDTQIMGHIMSTAAFFASTSVIVIGALLGVLIKGDYDIRPTVSSWIMIAPRDPLDIKLVLILIIAVHAFLSFTWCIRQANFAAVMIGAAPPPPLDPQLRERLSVSMGDIITHVARSYDAGMRSFYFAICAVTWIVSPVLLLLGTAAVVLLLLHRQTRSATATALQDIAATRERARNRSANRLSRKGR